MMIREKIQRSVHAIRANWFNLLFFSALVYVPFIPILYANDAWLGMIPIAMAYGWFIGKCVAERVWWREDVWDISIHGRRTRRKIYRKFQINSKTRKHFQDKYPNRWNVFEYF